MSHATTKSSTPGERTPLMQGTRAVYTYEEGLQRNTDLEQLEEGHSRMFTYSARTLNQKSRTGKMLQYDVNEMMGWHAFTQVTGTVLARKELWQTCAVYWAITATLALTFYLAHVYHSRVVHELKVDSDKNLAHIATITTYITALLGFMIGFFVSLSLQRWWSLRDNCLGALHRAFGDMHLYLAVRLTEREDAIHKETCLRLSLLCQRLVFLEAQKREGPEHLDYLIEVGLLTNDERDRLVEKPRKAQIALVWLDVYLHGPVMNTGRITYKTVRKLDDHVATARGAVGHIFAYIQTQLPFAYVHLLSLAVLLSNLLIAIKCGVAIGRNLAPDTPTDYIYQLVQWFHVFFVPFGYHAFVHLCDELSNPFGEDFGHFPGYAYHCKMRDRCTALHEAATDAPPALRLEKGKG